MKLKTTLIVSLVFGIIVIAAWNNNGYTSSTGAPGNYTGAPNEGNCTSCHQGSAANKAGLITSNVDTSGYIPGKTYTITTTVSQAGVNIFGFEITPKGANSSTNSGSIVVTNTSQTRAFSNHITHTSSGINATNNSKTWTFNWIAPPMGSGIITFYGAYNIGNIDVYLSKLAIKERFSPAGIAIEGVAAGKVGIFPNPAHDQIQYALLMDKTEMVNIYLTDLKGSVVKVLENQIFTSGAHQLNADISALPSGLYLLNVNTSNKNYIQKLVIE